jgi:hypothetical protein
MLLIEGIYYKFSPICFCCRCFPWQGYGRSLWLMQGMFKANGRCGYVKKPDFLLKTGPINEIFDPKASLPAKTTLKVRAILPGDLSSKFYNGYIHHLPH